MSYVEVCRRAIAATAVVLLVMSTACGDANDELIADAGSVTPVADGGRAGADAGDGPMRDASVPLDAQIPDDSGSEPDTDASVDEDAGPVGPGGGTDDDGSAGKPSPSCTIRNNPRPFQALNGGALLGAQLMGADQVRFALFAPRAQKVSVVGAFNGWDETADPLTKSADGVWTTTLTLPKPIGQEYRFDVDGRLVADPYAFANDKNEGNSIVIDRTYKAWSDADFVRPKRESLVIYEANVSDLSRHASSGVPSDLQGKYAGFELKIEHLKRLGVNAVEFMPVVENQSNGYSWGYNASLFFAPETALATSTKGAQVHELKHMINALHEAGIAVIVDVVYNHVWGQTGPNHFWGVDPLYYFDYDDDGDAEDDKLSWGYKMASWREAMKKLMYDNMKYLMSEYHVDGFRLDSTENMNIDAVFEVIRALDDDGYCDRFYLVEEFSGEHNTKIRALNKELGRVLISSWGTGYKNRLWDAVKYKGTSMTDLTNVTYFSRADGWGRSDEVVNYVTSHDEGTLNARFGASKDQVKVAAAHLLTSPGLPMMWAGDEFMRMHWGNYHPGGPGQNVREENNRIDWALATTNADLIDYYGALVRLRIQHPTLHKAVSEEVGNSFIWNNNDPESAIGYVRKGVSGDRDFVVLANYQEVEQTYKVAFPQLGSYRVMVADGQASADANGLASLDVTSASTDVKVAPFSAKVFMSVAPRP
jgi:1,4-alpha-glucan branching enzyme